jgi:hypothetical protein
MPASFLYHDTPGNPSARSFQTGDYGYPHGMLNMQMTAHKTSAGLSRRRQV